VAEPDETRGAETPPQSNEDAGTAGGPPDVRLDAHEDADPELKDYGPPADADRDPEPDAGESGAEEGISPWADEAYSDDPQGPTSST
jgi:hypothetical protein